MNDKTCVKINKINTDIFYKKPVNISLTFTYEKTISNFKTKFLKLNSPNQRLI